MQPLHRAALTFAAVLVLVPAAARAGDLDLAVPVLTPAVAAAATQLTTATSQADALLAPPVAVDALEDLRGGTDNKTIITNVSDVDGTVDGNSATNTFSSPNVVAGGSFGNAAGLSTVIQNSGNNVLIQNSTVVSIQFAPTP